MATDTTELAEIDEPEQTGLIVSSKSFDPQDARAHAIAELLAAAYSKASTLVLTQEESEGLAAEFPDDAFRLGAGGNNSLLYIEHAYLRQRLNQVLGIGQAVPVNRSKWTEPYTYITTDDKGNEVENHAVRVYVDTVLLVRGCVVGEAIGDHTYYPSNAAMTYSDSLESAKSNALRRCCKELGVGLQVWMKGFVEAWKERNRGAGKRTNQQPPGKPPVKPNGHTNGHAPTADKRTPAELNQEAGEFFGGLPPMYGEIKKAWLKNIAANECDAKRKAAAAFVVDQFSKEKLTQGEHDALSDWIVNGQPLPDDPNAQLPPVEPARGAQEDSHIRALVANGEFDEAAAHLEQSISSGAIRGEQSSALHNLIEQARKNAERGGFVGATT